MALGTSPFELVLQGNVNNGAATGTYTITFSSFGWPSKVEGSFTATRISGSGITPED